jgi:hypothetical protein
VDLGFGLGITLNHSFGENWRRRAAEKMCGDEELTFWQRLYWRLYYIFKQMLCLHHYYEILAYNSKQIDCLCIKCDKRLTINEGISQKEGE